MSIESSIVQLGQEIDRLGTKRINESNTKSNLIDPLLRALGWNVNDISEVDREYRPQPGDNPVDYALLAESIPMIYVEAKALGENLGDRKWTSQILGYASHAGVGWVVLTDGNEYRVYNQHAKGTIEDMFFLKVRVDGDRHRAIQSLNLLSKKNVKNGHIEDAWKAFSVNRKLHSTLQSLFGTNPNGAFVTFLRKRMPDLSEGEIRLGLQKVALQLVDWSPASSELGGPNSEANAREKMRMASKKPMTAGEGRTSITLSDLIDHGMITIPLEIAKVYNRQTLTARILGRDRIQIQDKEFRSLSSAAGFARAFANDSLQSGKLPETNGWAFWKFEDEDGAMKELDILRQRLQSDNNRRI